MKYINVFDQENFELKGVYQIGENITFENDTETNSTSVIQLPLYKEGKKIEYDIRELYVIEIKDNQKTLFIGMVTKITENEYFEVSFKDIMNIFDTKVAADGRLYINRTMQQVGIEDAIKYVSDVYFNNGPYAQNSIVCNALTHTTKQQFLTTDEGMFNPSTFFNNLKEWYDVVMDFSLVPYDTGETYNLNIDIYVDTSTERRIIDLKKMAGDIKETYQGNVLACVTVVGKGFVDGSDVSQKKDYILRTDGTIKPLSEGTADLVFGSRTTVLAEEWSAERQTAINQFKGNSYMHLFEFTSPTDYKVGEKVIIIDTKGNQVESMISGKKWTTQGYYYKTGKMRVKYIDQYLKEKRG